MKNILLILSLTTTVFAGQASEAFSTLTKQIDDDNIKSQNMVKLSTKNIKAKKDLELNLLNLIFLESKSNAMAKEID